MFGCFPGIICPADSPGWSYFVLYFLGDLVRRGCAFALLCLELIFRGWAKGPSPGHGGSGSQAVRAAFWSRHILHSFNACNQREFLRRPTIACTSLHAADGSAANHCGPSLSSKRAFPRKRDAHGADRDCPPSRVSKAEPCLKEDGRAFVRYR